MTRGEAIMKLSSLMMQCGMLMPIEWVRQNGEGSPVQEAVIMAQNALREQEERSKAVSNADRIRSMSDEELVRYFCVKGICHLILSYENGWCATHGSCEQCVRDWLKQPYKEDA